ncbi:CNDP dipeptidase [Phanerochaete sordida]|uniref:CNDP dipeptidase n=1 Tax=Phanerochaete sordida TaxID=48140 RepID=A0A9P3LKN0_9APHY|nr:CNDP dipeptidase [Phanerochaete sordida]
MVAPKQFLDYVEANSTRFIDRLAEAVAIPSISGDASRRNDVFKMAAWVKAELEKFGVKTDSIPLGKQHIEGQVLDLPPAIVGRIGDDPKKKTILIYGHFDVQPANVSDGWNTDPFKLHFDKETGKMFGRGSTDDKGPIMGWLNVLEAHHKQGLPLPVNLRFCFEGMEESGSEGLDDFIAAEAKKGASGWFGGVDAVCISDNYWLNDRTPALTYGLRGLAYFNIVISGPGADLHSGIFGGAVFEPMNALVALLGKLVTQDGRILIPGVYDGISAADADELQIYENLDYSVADLEAAAGGHIAVSQDKATVIMARMRNPSLSIHGIEGAFSGVGAKTVIPANVGGKFSLRLVPPQQPDDIRAKVEKYLHEEFAKLNTRCSMKIEYLHGGIPWVADHKHWNYEAAKIATESVYRKSPDFTREGGSIPVTLTFAENLGVNVLLLPMGRGDDGAHSTNEKLDVSNYIQGTKLLGSYLYEVAEITGTKA